MVKLIWTGITVTRGKKLLIFILSIILALIVRDIAKAEEMIIATKNTTTKEQAIAFLEDRNASKEMIDCIPFIYEYCEEVGIDATIIVGISSIETGYGKSNLFIHNNNPGGMKARKGWMKFNTLEDGYRTMINKIATMAGVRESSSFYYNSCYYVSDLGNVYWVENGCDRGYYNNLISQMNKIISYDTKVNDKPVVETKDNRVNLSAKDYIMSYIKKKRKSGLDMIYNRIGGN